MTFAYEPAQANSALRQGEILGPLWDHEAAYPPVALTSGQRIPVSSTVQDLQVILSPDCDLLWDFEARFEIPDVDSGEDVSFNQNPDSVSRVLVCGLYSYGEIRPRFKNQREVWRRVDQNQDERYHRLDSGPVTASDLVLHRLYLDFKKITTVPTSALYEGVLLGEVKRLAVIPDVWIHDLVHRFYGFLSRVAVPEPG